jgi:hypothetical protein
VEKKKKKKRKEKKRASSIIWPINKKKKDLCLTHQGWHPALPLLLKFLVTNRG